MHDLHFYLDGECSKEYGIQLQEPIVFPKPSRRYETIDIAGRNGSLHITQDAFESVSTTAKMFIIGANNPERVAMATQWLLGKRGARRLELPEEPEVYHTVHILDGYDAENRINLIGVFNVSLTAAPECRFKSGDVPIIFKNGGKIRNLYMPAKPLIEVTGSGDGTISVGGTTVSILKQTEKLFIDCDLQIAYNISMTPKNANIYTPSGFPELRTGDTMVAWSGGVTGVKITPRWWRL